MKGPPRCTQCPAPLAEGHANRPRACVESTRMTYFRLAGKEEAVARPIRYCGQTPSLQSQSSGPGFLRIRSQAKNQAYTIRLRQHGCRIAFFPSCTRSGDPIILLTFFLSSPTLLVNPCVGDANRQCSHPRNHTHALSHRNRAPGIENVEIVRTFQAQIVSTQQGISGRIRPSRFVHKVLETYTNHFIGVLLLRHPISGNQPLAFELRKLKVSPRALDVCPFEVVHRELLLISQTHVSILHFPARLGVARPHDVVDRIDILQESAQPLQTVGEFGRNRVEVDAATLLEISELRNLESIEHDLPPDAPSAQRRRLPVIFFELNVVLPQINTDRTERFK